MNDILSRFLIVFGSEPEAYRCFVNYMETVKDDFLDDGMLDKISKANVNVFNLQKIKQNKRQEFVVRDFLSVAMNLQTSL